MRFALAAALIGLLVRPSYAQSVHVDRITVTNYGIYRAQDLGDAIRDPVGRHYPLGGLLHAATTTNIFGKVGVRFGFEFVLVGSPQGTVVTLRRVNIYPPPCSSAPCASGYEYSAPVGAPQYIGYTFRHSGDIRLGPWRFEIWLGNRRLASQSFTVVPVKPEP
jgi:hypothetical protein